MDFAKSGLPTLLGSLASIIAALAAAKNPKYAPVISAGVDAINQELQHIQNGGDPTLHTEAGPIGNPGIVPPTSLPISVSGLDK